MDEIKPSISVEYSEYATIITFTADKILEQKEILSLGESIMAVVEQADGINLILDFINVKYLSSTVLGLLIRIFKRVNESRGNFRLCNIKPEILKIFKITRLTKVFDIYEDVEAAMAGLSSAD